MIRAVKKRPVPTITDKIGSLPPRMRLVKLNPWLITGVMRSAYERSSASGMPSIMIRGRGGGGL